MKLRLGSSNITLTIGTIFICLFSFVAPILVFSNIGINETTLVGFMLILAVCAFMYHTYKTNLPKKNYEIIIALVLLPVLAAFAGLLVFVMNNHEK